MRVRKKALLPILIISFLMLLLFYLIFFPEKSIWNLPGTIGNTGGNLNNRGLFCEYNNIVYFSNPYDGGTLYSMNPDETGIKKLSDFTPSYINASGDFLYFYVNDSDSEHLFQKRGLYRTHLDGTNSTSLARDAIGTCVLVDNYLYYQSYQGNNQYNLQRIRIDRKDKSEVTPFLCNPASAFNSTIYLNGTTTDHNLYSLTVSDSQVTALATGNFWNPVYYNDFVYFQDLNNNYQLCKFDLNTQETTTLSMERVDFFNVCDTYVYFQTSGDSGALKRIRLDGTQEEVIKEGYFENINITSQYVYFNAFSESTPVYKYPTYGNGEVTIFDVAKTAALK